MQSYYIVPTMKDRALQALTLQALEPEWEARFEPNSYGFRAGRSCHDAIEAIFNCIRYKPKFVLDADIASCFDRIDHSALLKKTFDIPYHSPSNTSLVESGGDGQQAVVSNTGGNATRRHYFATFGEYRPPRHGKPNQTSFSKRYNPQGR